MNENSEKSETQKDKLLESQLSRLNAEIAELESIQTATEKTVDRLVGAPSEDQSEQLQEASVGEPFTNRLGQVLTRLENLRRRTTHDYDRLSEVV